MKLPRFSVCHLMKVAPLRNNSTTLVRRRGILTCCKTTELIDIIPAKVLGGPALGTVLMARRHPPQKLSRAAIVNQALRPALKVVASLDVQDVQRKINLLEGQLDALMTTAIEDGRSARRLADRRHDPHTAAIDELKQATQVDPQHIDQMHAYLKGLGSWSSQMDERAAKMEYAIDCCAQELRGVWAAIDLPEAYAAHDDDETLDLGDPYELRTETTDERLALEQLGASKHAQSIEDSYDGVLRRFRGRSKQLQRDLAVLHEDMQSIQRLLRGSERAVIQHHILRRQPLLSSGVRKKKRTDRKPRKYHSATAAQAVPVLGSHFRLRVL